MLAHSLCKITGHQTQYLGANIPSRALVETLGILEPDLLLVTCTQQTQKNYGNHLREFFDGIISARYKPEIWVGGTGASIMTAYAQRQGIRIVRDFKELAYLLASSFP